MTRNHLTTFGLLAALVTVALDQASKYWVLETLDLPALGSVPLLPMLSLTMVWNRGITFGLFSGGGAWNALILGGLALAMVVVLAVWLRRAERLRVALALGMVIGGAIGNVSDRVQFGAVADFIHLHAWGWSWYVFNVSDAAIVCGVAALVLDSLFPPKAARLADDPAAR